MQRLTQAEPCANMLHVLGAFYRPKDTQSQQWLLTPLIGSSDWQKKRLAKVLFFVYAGPSVSSQLSHPSIRQIVLDWLFIIIIIINVSIVIIIASFVKQCTRWRAYVIHKGFLIICPSRMKTWDTGVVNVKQFLTILFSPAGSESHLLSHRCSLAVDWSLSLHWSATFWTQTQVTWCDASIRLHCCVV